jgi:hypothetical protein
MDKSGAEELFKLVPGAAADEVQSAIEEKLFAIKKDLLQKYMVPLLLRNKMQQIRQYMLAEITLKGEGPVLDEDIVHWTSDTTDRIAFIEEYEAHISRLKLAVMNSPDFGRLHLAVQALILVQEYYMVVFRMLFNEFSEALPEEVNTRDIIDTGKLLLSLRSGILDDKQTWAIELELARIDKLHQMG